MDYGGDTANMPETKIDSIEEIEIRDQALSETANSEMTNRETWNRKNPPTEAVIVKDLKTTELTPREYRNTKARFYRLGGDIRLQPHVSELPPKGESVNHRHTTEAVIYIVRGTGHTIISWDGVNKQRIDWDEGDMFSFPVWMWHQHFNDSETEVARYLAVQDTFAVKALGLHQIERFPEG
jgi:quercetin dioxygenase-like cupin family protein